nr:MAG TPA: hypothetical protein [Caudoviricetes sp.]
MSSPSQSGISLFQSFFIFYISSAVGIIASAYA